jgi:YgiT-type zinc finger domain-containing protein
VIVMDKPAPTCKNGQPMIWGKTTFSYEQDDILVEVSDIPAWICPGCDDVSFTPGTSQQLITTIRELIVATKRARAKDIPLYKYYVKAA